MSRTPLLLIEDEPAIAENVLFALSTAHFAPVWCATGAEGLREFAAGSFSFVILDIGLPDVSGLDVCRILRRSSLVPILFLSARDEELDRVLGLELGADDYVVKPFSPRELVARVRAILRRSNRQGPDPLPSASPPAEDLVGSPSGHAPAGNSPPPRASHLNHDPDRKRFHAGGKPLELTAHEYHLLVALTSQPGRVFSRDQLMELAWEDPAASADRTVDAHIKTLRAKLRVAAPGFDPIETRRGLGYSLREDVLP